MTNHQLALCIPFFALMSYNAPLRAAGFRADTAHPGVWLEVNAARDVQPFSREILGVNIGTWTFYWGRPYPNDSPKLRALARNIRPGVIRYAGGLASNLVKWDRNSPQCYPYRVTDACHRHPLDPKEDGVDRCGKEPQKVSAAYRHIYQPDEIDALVAFARHVGAEIMIQVNISTCDPEMWADFVRYANVEKKYGIRYFELGNELDLLNTQNNPQPSRDEYVRRFKIYHRAMKAVDPSIQIMGPASASGALDDSYFKPYELYIKPLMHDAEIRKYKMLDGLSFHQYQVRNGQREIGLHELFELNEETNRLNHGSAPLKSGSTREAIADHVTAMQELLNQEGFGSVPISISEFNSVAADRPTAFTFNHVAALYMADMLPRIASRGAKQVMHWELYDQPMVKSGETSFGLISHNGSTITFYPPNKRISLEDNFAPVPAYYGYLLLAKLLGDMIVESKTDHEQLLSVWGTRFTSDPNRLAVLVVNMRAQAMTTTLALKGFAARDGVVHRLENPSFVAAEDKKSVLDGTKINGQEVNAQSAEAIEKSIAAIFASGSPIKIAGDVLTAEVAPFSAIVFVLSK